MYLISGQTTIPTPSIKNIPKPTYNNINSLENRIRHLKNNLSPINVPITSQPPVQSVRPSYSTYPDTLKEQNKVKTIVQNDIKNVKYWMNLISNGIFIIIFLIIFIYGIINSWARCFKNKKKEINYQLPIHIKQQFNYYNNDKCYRRKSDTEYISVTP